MTADQFRNVRTADPFQPFTIQIAGGRTYKVQHRDFVSQSPGGRTIIVYHQAESFSIVDLALVTEVEVEGLARAE
jgi:hypothetical protein